MVVPRWRAPTDVPQHPRSKADQALLDALAGPVDRTAADALEPLRGRRPNIVLWVWESVSSDHLAALHPLGRARTPHLDRMMAEGSLNFSTAYAECPLTVQTTWALLTGRRPPAMPFVFVADTDLPPHGPALPGELRRAGYRTACFYASYAHMWGTRRLFDIEPFDLFEDADAFVDRGGYAVSGIGVQDDAIVDRGLEWVSAQPRTQPFFLMLWNTETHRPYTWAGMPDEVRSRPDYDRYLAAVERGDQLLGRLRDGLAARGVLDDTVLVVVGDHGEAFGRAPRTWHWNHASQVFEDEVHVPFVFIHPALRAATVSMPCTHADLFPTLLDMAGVPLPSGLSGRSLARPAVPGPLFMRATLWWPLAIRTGRYKLILPGPTVPPLLYDIVDDPEERQDLTWTRPDTARAMRSALQQWHSDRFRSDPTFGYKMPSLARLFVRPMTRRSDQWERPPGSPPHR